MGHDGRVSIHVQKLTKTVDYTVILHVWAGGLGSFERSQLPQYQLESIDRDVCCTMGRVYAGAGAVLVIDPALSSIALRDGGLAGEDQDQATNIPI